MFFLARFSRSDLIGQLNHLLTTAHFCQQLRTGLASGHSDLYKLLYAKCAGTPILFPSSWPPECESSANCAGWGWIALAPRVVTRVLHVCSKGQKPHKLSMWACDVPIYPQLLHLTSMFPSAFRVISEGDRLARTTLLAQTIRQYFFLLAINLMCRSWCVKLVPTKCCYSRVAVG